MSARKSIPVHFMDGQLAVSSEFAREKLGYQFKSDAAWYKFWSRFRQLNDIRPVRGIGSYPLRQIEAACAAR